MKCRTMQIVKDMSSSYATYVGKHHAVKHTRIQTLPENPEANSGHSVTRHCAWDSKLGVVRNT